MKISLVSMRPLPGASRPAMSRSGSSPVIPPRPSYEDTPPCPTCVDPASWTLLGRRIADAQAGAVIAHPDFRSAVARVVRELRLNGEGWDVVYATLDSAVQPALSHGMTGARELEVYATRSASIVAHMASWADVARLAEIEEEGLAS